MKIIVCLFSLFALTFAQIKTSNYDRYKNIDLDEILNNRRLLIPYIKCVLDEGKCSPNGKELKSHIREGLENGCRDCTEIEKQGSDKLLGHLINKEKEYWARLSAKYDPEHKYTPKFEKELRITSA